MFVGIYWQEYGWVAPGENVSGLEHEYLLSADMPKLIYVKAAGVREPRLDALLARIKADDQVSYKRFGAAVELTELLADDLAILLTERFSRHSEVPARALRRPSLPVPPTDLVGRNSEMEVADAALNDPAVRLVTLVGPGGIGKPRLALELGRMWMSAVPGVVRPAWFVDLASVRDPSLWVNALADALGIRPEVTSPGLDLIIDRPQGLSALLVFDNFEQVTAAGPELAGFLAACPRITALVTSRTALRLRGEREMKLTPLRSYSLLTDSERTLFARLSVLSGSWTLAACEAVATVNGDLDALTTLNSLVARSLVRTSCVPDSGVTRLLCRRRVLLDVGDRPCRTVSATTLRRR